MNFVKAFSETIGKETAAPVAPTAPTASTAPTVPDNFTSDDMKSYVDAKFEALKSDLLHEMQSLRQVETSQETPGKDAIIRPEEEKPGVDSTIENK